MKKLILAGLLLFASVPAHAVGPQLSQLAIVGDVSANAGLFVDKSTIYTFGTIESATTDAVITSYDAKGALISRRIIDGGGSDYIAAGASDGQGNYWFVGGDSPAQQAPEPDTATSNAVNPDGVVIEKVIPLRNDIKNIALWKFSLANGEITRFSYEMGSAVLATSISADARGASITGLYRGKTGNQNFLLSASALGKFSAPILIGGSGTTINAVQRASDGTIDLFGASTEVLGGTKRVGKIDGILVKVRGGKIVQVVRSSAAQAEREWISVGSSTFTLGTVKTGKKIEAVATKFAAFKPVWSVRYPSTGSVTGFLNSTGAYFAYSTSTGMTLATFSTKGVASRVFTSNALASPIAMAYSKELGVLTLAINQNQAALFTPTSG